METVKINSNSWLYKKVYKHTKFDPENQEHLNLCTYRYYASSLFIQWTIGIFIILIVAFSTGLIILHEFGFFFYKTLSLYFVIPILTLFGLMCYALTVTLISLILFSFNFLLERFNDYSLARYHKKKAKKTSLLNRMWKDFKEKKCSKIEIQ